MEKLTYNLNGEEYITLPKLLKTLDLINSGGEIRYFIEQEDILYNGKIEFRKRKKCYCGDKIIFNKKISITIV